MFWRSQSILIAPATAETTRTAGQRVDAIDFWRGFALVTIFIDHMPESIFQHMTYRNFGLSDAAELFVFLSGASVALAYGTRFFRGERRAAIKAVFRRAFTLYWVQVLTSLIVIGLFAAAALYCDNDDLVEDADRNLVVSSPLTGISAMLVLLHQLGNVNILPLYIVLLLIAPGLLWLARVNDWLMLLVSAALYASVRMFEINLPNWPLNGGWYFNPLAWQLIFAIGLFVGRRIKSGGISYDRTLFLLCLVVVVVSCLAATDGFGLVPGLRTAVLDVVDHSKTNLGLARLMHFLALAYVITCLGTTNLLRLTPIFAPLALMGRYSLPVFATGSVLAALGEVIVETRAESFSHQLALGSLIVAVGIVVHYLVARLRDARQVPRPRPAFATAMR
jgi:hypothetical protein